MHPVLLTIDPWPLWTYPIIVGIIGLAVVIWRLVERRMGEQIPPPTAASLLTTAFAVLAVSAFLHWLTNQLAPVQIHSYGAMLILAFAAGIGWLMVTARTYDIAPVQWIDFALFVLLGGLIGARILYVILNWEQYAGTPLNIFAVWEGGLTYFGGIAGALLGAYLFSRLREIDFKLLADLAAPATALGYSLARIGCFLNGCCYGHAGSPNWPLGMIFPPDSEAGQGQVPIHPTQLYASFASIIIFYILVKIQPHIKARGNLLLVYLVLYSVYRFIVEFYRRGATAKVFTLLAPLTEAQTASIVIGALAMVWFLARRARAQADN